MGLEWVCDEAGEEQTLTFTCFCSTHSMFETITYPSDKGIEWERDEACEDKRHQVCQDGDDELPQGVAGTNTIAPAKLPL